MRVEIHESARKHGVSEEDIRHAFDHATGWVQIGDDPVRYMMAGPNLAGNLIELVLLVGSVELIIHAMDPLRPVNRRLIFPRTRT